MNKSPEISFGNVLKRGLGALGFVATTYLTGGCAGGQEAVKSLEPTTPPATGAPSPTRGEPNGVPTEVKPISAPYVANTPVKEKATRPVILDHNVKRLAIGAEGVASASLSTDQIGQTTNFGEGRTLATLGTGEGSTRLYDGGTSARILDAPNSLSFGGQTYTFVEHTGSGGLARYKSSDGKEYLLPTDVDSEAYAISVAVFSTGADGPMVQAWDGKGNAVAPILAGWREFKPGEKVMVDSLGNLSIVSVDGKISWRFDSLDRDWEQVALAQVATAQVPPTSAPTPPASPTPAKVDAAPTAVNKEVESQKMALYPIAFELPLSAEVDGIQVNLSVGYTDRFEAERDYKGIVVAREDAAKEHVAMALKMVWRSWVSDDVTGRASVTYNQWVGMVKKGEVVLKIPAVDGGVDSPNKNQDRQIRDWKLEVKNGKPTVDVGVVFDIATVEGGYPTLPLNLSTQSNINLVLVGGKLLIVGQFFDTEVSVQKDYKVPERVASAAVDMQLSSRVGHLLLSATNNDGNVLSGRGDVLAVDNSGEPTRILREISSKVWDGKMESLETMKTLLKIVR
ncbi:MAG: hypothetical protein WCV93_03415 [Candidatus Shapirobacteria bacterium]